MPIYFGDPEESENRFDSDFRYQWLKAQEVHLPDTPRGCVVTYNRKGNERTSFGRKTVGKIVWEATKGEVPEGHDVIHTCGHRGCILTDHLMLRPQSKGRQMYYAAIRMEDF